MSSGACAIAGRSCWRWRLTPPLCQHRPASRVLVHHSRLAFRSTAHASDLAGGQMVSGISTRSGWRMVFSAVSGKGIMVAVRKDIRRFAPSRRRTLRKLWVRLCRSGGEMVARLRHDQDKYYAARLRPARRVQARLPISPRCFARARHQQYHREASPGEATRRITAKPDSLLPLRSFVAPSAANWPDSLVNCNFVRHSAVWLRGLLSRFALSPSTGHHSATHKRRRVGDNAIALRDDGRATSPAARHIHTTASLSALA